MPLLCAEVQRKSASRIFRTGQSITLAARPTELAYSIQIRNLTRPLPLLLLFFIFSHQLSERSSCVDSSLIKFSKSPVHVHKYHSSTRELRAASPEMAQATAQPQPIEATAAEAAAVPASSKQDEGTLITTSDKMAPENEESLELHGKKLAAAFAGMMVSLSFIADKPGPLLNSLKSSLHIVHSARLIFDCARPDNLSICSSQNRDRLQFARCGNMGVR